MCDFINHFHSEYQQTDTLTKSEEPDEMLHNAACNQGLQCL